MRFDMEGRDQHTTTKVAWFFSLAVWIASPFAPGISKAQEAPTSSAAKPTERVLGTITKVSSAAQTVTVKEDKTGTEYVIQLANTPTLLKVAPGAKDVKGATRITANDLAEGDRVDVRGFKAEDDPSGIAARSVVLMSGRDLAQAHAAESAAWQHSTPGVVTAVDPAAKTLSINSRS